MASKQIPLSRKPKTWTFETALYAWSDARAQAEVSNDGDFEVAESAEAFLLDTAPMSRAHAAAILDVVLAQPDDRIDGRDWEAVRKVRDFLVTSADGVPVR